MKGESFEELRVYRAAEGVGDLVWEIVSGWDPFAKDTVGKQLVRAADSIGANIAEGYGRKSYADNRRFVAIARGSLMETRHWLRRAHKRNLLTKDQTDALKTLLEPLPKSLNAYLKFIGPTNTAPITSDQ
ncbi:MAG: four helix bundle protein [Terrimicrobiaceae bacterium]